MSEHALETENAGAGYADEAEAAAAFAARPDDAALDDWEEPEADALLEGDDGGLGMTNAEALEALTFARELRAQSAEIEHEQGQLRIREQLEQLLDPLSPDYVRNQLHFAALVQSGELTINPDGTIYVEESVGADDEPADLARSAGEWEPEALPAAEAEGMDEWRIANAESTVDEMLGRVGPDVDRVAVRARANEIIDAVHRESGLSGSDLAAKAIEEAAIDIKPAASEMDVVQRIFARQRAGLPPTTLPAGAVRSSSAEASMARVEETRLERVAERALKDANLAADEHEASDELEAVRRLTARSRVLRVGG